MSRWKPWGGQPTLLGYPLPRARQTDSDGAHLAADLLAPANQTVCDAIRRWVEIHGPGTAFEIADGLGGHGWQSDTIRSACARAGLEKLPRAGSHRGRTVAVYALRGPSS